MKGPIPADRVYFNESRVQEAFEGLPRSYDNKTNDDDRLRIASQVTYIYRRKQDPRTKGRDLYRRLCEIHEKCWLTWEDPEAENEDRIVKRIGIWGQIWALAVTWSLVSKDHKRFNIKRLAEAIVEYGIERKFLDGETFEHELTKEDAKVLEILSVENIAALSPKTYRELLHAYLRRGDDPSIVPSLPASIALRKCVVEFVFEHLVGTDFAPKAGVSADTIIKFLDDEDCTTPQECFWRLVTDHLGIREAVDARENDINNIPKQTGFSFIEPSVWRYITALESDKRSAPPGDVKQTVIDITDVLNYRGTGIRGRTEKPMAILSGPAHSGKKSVLGDFFKALKQGREVVLTCNARHGQADPVELPTLCIQTRDRDYVSLCVEVMVFLERIIAGDNKAFLPQEEATKARWAVLDQGDGVPSLPFLLNRIDELHRETPAFFVFMDVRATSYTDMRSLIRRHGIGRLVETLSWSNSDSRFLLTTEKVDNQFAKFDHENFPLLSPTCARLSWYLSEDQEKEFAVLADAHDFEALKNKSVWGDVLMALSILFSERDVQREEFFSMLTTICEGKLHPSVDAVDYVCRRLIASWHAEHLTPYIALIAASSDGMMSETLKTCVAEWQNASTGLEFASDADALKKLQDLSKLGRGLFLRFQAPPNFLAEERRFDEPPFHVNNEYFWTWEFDAGFAKVISRILATDPAYQAILRGAYRLVSIQARIRAQHRQMRGLTGQRSFGQQVPERSVQAFVALILSMEQNAPLLVDDSGRKSQPSFLEVVHSAPNVFTMATGRFDQDAAIRYAYDILLKAEADYDERLSMTLDTDLLRLQLYTLLCASPGSVLSWNDDRLKELKSGELPLELVGADLRHLDVFPLKARAQILTSLGMAAFYGGYHAILVWAEAKLVGLGVDDEAVLDDLSRLISARADLECQIGSPLEEDPSETDNRPQDLPLVQVRSKLKKDVARVRAAQAALAAPQKTTVAWRLERRIAQLDALVDPHRSDATSAAPLSAKIANDVRQGRTARLSFKTMLHQFPLLSKRIGETWRQPFEPSTSIDMLDRMIDANILRLAHYAGSERALTLIDHARKLMMQGLVLAAQGAIESARDICFLGASSDSVRLEVLYLETTILIASAEIESVGRKLKANEIKETAEAILLNLEFIDDITDAHGLKFEKAMQYALAWRAQIMAAKIGTAIKLPFKEEPFETACKIADEFGAAGFKQVLRELHAFFEEDRRRKS